MEKPRILLADDALDTRDLMAVLFRFAPLCAYDVQIVDDGTAALSAWREAREAGPPFALLVLDIQMVKNGFSLLREIREAENEQGLSPTPALFYTAFPRYMNELNARDAGAQGMLIKPLFPLALHEAFTRVLENPEGQFFVVEPPKPEFSKPETSQSGSPQRESRGNHE